AEGRTVRGGWPAGKPVGRRGFSGHPGPPPTPPGGRRDATDFKAAWRRTVLSGGTSCMALLSSKKRESRKSLSQPGWITLEGGFAARQCVVQDLSATGAKVTID